mmetsp:Transcript_17526/g.31645  ORF Transcript_17526/g.31645 Transcript_17526/m.31645 type:complete len:203 (+) Transcript_17526:393-1001(+)
MQPGATSNVASGPRCMPARLRLAQSLHGDAKLELTSASLSTLAQTHASAASQSPAFQIGPRMDCHRQFATAPMVDHVHQVCRTRPWPLQPGFDLPPAAQSPQYLQQHLRSQRHVRVCGMKLRQPCPFPCASFHCCVPSQRMYAQRRPDGTSIACPSSAAENPRPCSSTTCTGLRHYLLSEHVLPQDPFARMRILHLHSPLPS